MFFYTSEITEAEVRARMESLMSDPRYWKVVHTDYNDLEGHLNTMTREGWTVHSIGHGIHVDKTDYSVKGPPGVLMCSTPHFAPGCMVIFSRATSGR